MDLDFIRRHGQRHDKCSGEIPKRISAILWAWCLLWPSINWKRTEPISGARAIPRDAKGHRIHSRWRQGRERALLAKSKHLQSRMFQFCSQPLVGFPDQRAIQRESVQVRSQFLSDCSLAVKRALSGLWAASTRAKTHHSKPSKLGARGIHTRGSIEGTADRMYGSWSQTLHRSTPWSMCLVRRWRI